MPQGGATRPKGSPKTPGSGRKKGSVNRVSAALKDAIMHAFDKAGGVEYLVKQADLNPIAFLTLLGRIVPREVEAQVDVHDATARIEALNRGRERARKALRARAKRLAEAQ